MAHRLAGVALLVAGLLLALAGASPEPSHLSVSAAGFVNSDRPGIANHNSPAVAADPTRPSVLALADRIDSPKFNCTLSLSTTAGVTWKPLALPLPPDAPNCFWPDVAFDSAGHLLVLYTASGGRYNQPVGAWLQRFDGETASGPPTKVAPTEAFHAHFAVDGTKVVVAYVQTPPANADRPLGFEPGPNPLMVVRSSDGGATFGPPAPISTTERVAHPSVVIGANGSVLVGALDYNDDVADYEGQHDGKGGPPPAAHWRILMWRSTDGGTTFTPSPIVVADQLPVPQRVVIDLAPGPSFAADPARNRVYAAWDAGVAGTGSGGRDVFVAESADGGATWHKAVAVGPRKNSQYLPALDVAPGGRVDLVFYDRSKDPQDVLAQAVVASSWDGGRTFATGVASEHRFDSRIGQGGPQQIPQLGNQLAVYSRDDGFVAFWADTARSAPGTDVMDLAVATVTPHERTSRSWPLLALGVALVVAGAALAISWRREPASPAARALP